MSAALGNLSKLNCARLHDISVLFTCLLVYLFTKNVLSMFTFKQFTIDDSACAMKVGTDGVLLGAWAEADPVNTCRVLDIGTGSGLIALMLAQRLPESRIVGIDIVPEAVEAARRNAAASPFAERLEMVCADVCHYQPENGELFEAIVSNPPNHTEELLPPCAARAAARHTAALSFAALFVHARRLLRQGGTFALIVPAAALKEVKGEAMLGGFSLMRRTFVVTRTGKPPKRELLQFVLGAAPQVAVCDTLPLMPADGSNARSEAYAALTKDFYL